MPHASVPLPDRSTLPPPPTGLEPRFSVTAEPERDLVRYVVAGFFDAASIDAVQARQAAVVRALTCAPNRHVTIVDVSGCRIQSQATMQQFARMLDQPRYRSRALAIVVGGSLARMQVTRHLSRPRVAFFTTVAEAEAWLFADGSASAGADRVGD